MRRRAALAMLAVVAMAVSGCAVASDPTWVPPTWPDDEIRVAPVPEPLDPATVAAVAGERLRNDEVGVQARFAVLPGVDAVNDRVVGLVRDAVGARAAQTGVAYSPQVFPPGAGLADRACVRGSSLRSGADVLADPELGPAGGSGTAVVCDLVAATGSILGQRLRVVTGDAAGVAADATTTLYADVASGAISTAAELWSPDAAGQLRMLIVDLLRREGGALSLAPVASADEASLAAFLPVLDSTVPGPLGSLVVTVPAGFSAPELVALGAPATPAPLSILVPADLAATLVTPIGALLVAAGSAEAAFESPTPTPAGRMSIDCDLLPCVALTYDDGPSELTPGILDALAAHRAAATFFTMGEKAAGYGDLLRRMVAEGHLVENHSWNHPHLTQIPIGAAQRQVRDTTGAIEQQTGERVTMFRPPYGHYNAEVLAVAGLPAILWDVDAFDWQGPADDVLLSRVVGQPRPGSIVLQHDIHENTARTAGAVYDGLLDRGFSLVTVAQLFGGHAPAAGAWRSGR